MSLFVTLGGTVVQQINLAQSAISREHLERKLASGELQLFSGELERIDRPAVNGYGAPAFWLVAEGSPHPAEDRWPTLCTRTNVGTVVDGELL